MAISPTECDAWILAGGKSRRMGRCKAFLPIGPTTILQYLTQELSSFSQVYLSANDSALYAGFPGPVVRDRYPNCGPLAGIHTGLCTTDKDYLFCVPCDMPCFTRNLIPPMLEAFQRDLDALVCMDSAGAIHPLCGIYAKSALPAMEKALQTGTLRMKSLLQTLRCGYLSSQSYVDDSTFLNLNTPEEYARFIHAKSNSLK